MKESSIFRVATISEGISTEENQNVDGSKLVNSGKTDSNVDEYQTADSVEGLSGSNLVDEDDVDQGETGPYIRSVQTSRYISRAIV